ncbi:hypothetical protein L7F22_044312 [Adiantum nelumboides]|nr:hypothetical protein [Adiantum nelumboides]
MLSKDDQGDAQPGSVSNKEDVVGSAAHCLTPFNAFLTEHDYLGLSKAPSLPLAQNTQSVYSIGHDQCDREGAGLECGDTELRLGIGPVRPEDASPASHVAHGIQSMSHRQRLILEIDRQSIKGGDSGPSHPPCGTMFMNTAMELGQSFLPCIAPGRFGIPVSKVSTAPGKRSFIEMGSETHANSALASDFLTESVTQTKTASQFTVGPQLPMVASSLQGGLYTWSHSCSNVANWPSNLDASSISGNSYTSATNRSLVSLPAFKVPPALPAGNYSSLPRSTPASAVTLHSSPSSNGNVLLSRCSLHEDARLSKASVVGWPPVRSFRKNTLHSTAAPLANNASNASLHVLNHEDTSEAGEEQKIVSSRDILFVKAKLDGVRICRKVDLTSYNNYESLKSALQEMFQGFVCSDNAKLDLLQGKNYVLTHEDKDGDWMLVGDVPWPMFITTVKSLRIMRAVDAVGLGGKVFAKGELKT